MGNSTGSLAPITNTASGTARTNAINNDDLSWLKSGILAKAANNNVQDVLRDQIQKQASMASSSAPAIQNSADTLTSAVKNNGGNTFNLGVTAQPDMSLANPAEEATKALKDTNSFKAGLALGDGPLMNGAIASKYGPDWVDDYSIPLFGKSLNIFGVGA